MSKYLAISVTYNPDKIDQSEIANSFNGHDGGGYCFVDGLRDEFFNQADVSKSNVKAARSLRRNLRRRKGVVGVSVVILDDEE